jgi:hypothetical protein
VRERERERESAHTHTHTPWAFKCIYCIYMERLSYKILLFIAELILATLTVCEVVSQCVDLIFIVLTKHGHKYENILHPPYLDFNFGFLVF